MAKELVFGHQNPDTDAIAAAIAYAYLMKQKGYDTEAVALGEPNDETRYALNYFHHDAPRVVKTVANEVDKVMLVDHNEPQQSAPDIAKVTVTHVIDHHRIHDFNTAQPLYYHAEPVGCVSTIVYAEYQQAEVAIPKDIAGLMASAIISDTLLLKSPTTTDKDRHALAALAELAGVDPEQYGLAMLKAGTNIADKPAANLIDEDAKSFTMNGQNIRIAQVNTVDLADVKPRIPEFKDAMATEAKKDAYDLFVVMVTNILNSDTLAIVVGNDAAKATFAKAFKTTLTDDTAALPGVVSRKKQVVPPLTEAFGG
ncbi:manganese-dependent inorganic pyrophosphatase [Schleiferilactobacillus perolens]|jgi:manganese-dependent inorganic pyrophosphatase|uniref:manganese-dependent inorganic pyrophosphatase n=1 Tax=Schleiferilactobacillus perolens TaxID=100468 RepID=UPI0023577E5C|nr:manganese-dependent inorganic pyrophosphatase [Schleiferilactobacillus perolens]MCI1890721.1 manganese-dependent inorganic pyrophosphatase [Schleiferilactobacillus harbinensis]MCI1913236.1 manganese-dependent inorganic pyrophosphatase [Schleiferilactobacillus harbinensis]MCI2172257.1 manganese-dependent inorganic pyrophosphatase [Schleiferilactobacillus perolens]